MSPSAARNRLRPPSSVSSPDGAWDAFLEATPLGQFQQSTRWARTKAREGWHALRVFFKRDPVEAGGLQVLWKRSRLGRIGYVSKGPVLPEETPEAIADSLKQVRATACRLGLRAVIVQPPDDSTITPPELCRYGFSAMPVSSVISATLLVDLTGGAADVERRVSRTMRRDSLRALRQGVSVCPGGREHLRTFFDLMQSTCRRQRTKPNPARLEVLEALWDAFAPRVRLAFARLGDEFLAGLLLIGFGGRVTFWRKGWTAALFPAHANALLNTHELLWASSQDYRVADVVGLDRDMAARMLSGRHLSASQQRSRHIFNLRLGGKPQLLPPGMILVTDPVLRSVFNGVSRLPIAQRLVSHLMSAA